MIKQIKISLGLLCIALILFNCKKAPQNNTVAEENLVIAVEPDPGSTTAKALGATYDFNVLIESKMPAQGVTASVTYRKDADNSVIFSQALESSASSIDFTITNIPVNEIGTVTVDVKSKSKPSNVANKTFKLARK